MTDEPVTTSARAVVPGTDLVTPAVMEPYINNGANLVINEGQPDQEFVTVSAVTATTFTATFAQRTRPISRLGASAILSNYPKTPVVLM